jgi:DNA-binding transcriptional LysR family regulator
MSVNQLTDLDLRLLRVLDALLETNSVKGAAVNLGLTSSAISHSLAALRHRIGDPLFVRTGNALAPTPRAASIRDALRGALVQLQGVIREDIEFDLASSQRQFSLAAPDFIIERMSAMVARLRKTAPGLRIRLLGLDQRVSERLANGDIDVAITPGQSERYLLLDHQTMRVRATSDRFVCIVNPAVAARIGPTLDLEHYAALPHIFVSVSGTSRGAIDDALERAGYQRHIALTIASAGQTVQFVADSDMVATVPESRVQAAVAAGTVVAYTPPLDLPVADTFLWWHARFQHDRGHAWWRGAILESCIPPPIA